jgi:hypothetical protein
MRVSGCFLFPSLLAEANLIVVSVVASLLTRKLAVELVVAGFLLLFLIFGYLLQFLDLF